ncbi:Similar to S.cerevisiae protein BRO1 (Cytoplasmic class E vacuolar protein sorting (VPS) factor) [Malassezia sympodialis ATCC 42132]|uniref:BRO domain-containing protein 1 n=2 Tax=Malassezia sympodialis (strain ATCC 42132) TaxID=1230383 RepID=A0A1M8A365_MALS4|nr:Similar to S.cerevisiae protein BRO1 (Cytoplasmic class E vacuolar protein sorting (VPS) factor) [Malassezia sympodialis ATCC 42132]
MQSPLIALPLKETRDVDLVKPITELIVKSYEQSPVKYKEELERIRQARKDAMSLPNSEETGRDLLFAYFHMLEMIEFRFPEIKLNFQWHDAFTRSKVKQDSLAYEKACTIFNMAARVTHVSAQLNRADSGSDALKRAYNGFRQAAGFLEYIKDSFMYAPSDDLQGTMLQSLVALLLAQASEIFLEKTLHDGKGAGLIAKLASHTSHAYGTLHSEWSEPSASRHVPPAWIIVAYYKSRYFASMAQLYRAKVDAAANHHAIALSRYRLAHTLAKEAHAFSPLVMPILSSHLRSTLPNDTVAALQHIFSAQVAVSLEALREAERENDLVYHERALEEGALPAIDQTSVAMPITIRETFSQPEVQSVLGPDVLRTLVPLGVLESASVYSEEQAKLIRAESARVDAANAQISVSLSALHLPESLERYASLEGAAPRECAPSEAVLSMAQELSTAPLTRMERVMDTLLKRAPPIVDTIRGALADLDDDARECERARVQYGADYTQPPTASVARTLRRDLKNALDALDAAHENDSDVVHLWQQVAPDVRLLVAGPADIRQMYKEQARVSGSKNLLDADVTDTGPARELLRETRALLDSVAAMPQERERMLQAFKQRVRSDDISRVLLLNRRVPNGEATVFQQELGKYLPMQCQITDHIQLQQKRMVMLKDALQRLDSHPGTMDARRAFDASRATALDGDARLSKAYEAYTEIQATLAKAHAFYDDMASQADMLASSAARLVAERRAARADFAERPASSAALGSYPTASTTLAEDLAALHMTSEPRMMPAPPPGPALHSTAERRNQPVPPPRPPRI